MRRLIVDGQTKRVGDRLIVWVRFRHEANEISAAITAKFPGFVVHKLVGGQSHTDRMTAINALSPRHIDKPTPDGMPVIVVANTAAGKTGLNLIAAAHVIYVSRDWSLTTQRQSEKRVHRKGQTRRVWYNTLQATGPNGEKTVDHAILKSLETKHSLSSWTASQWQSAIKNQDL